MFFQSMSIGNKGFITFLILLIVAVSFISWLTYTNNRRSQEAMISVDHSNEVLYATEELMSTFKDLHLFSHNYLFTRRESYIHRLDSAAARADSGIASLRKLVAGNLTQTKLVDSLAFYIEQRIDFSRMVVQTALEGDTLAAFDAISTGRGIELMSRLSVIIEKIREIERRILQQRQRTAAATSEQFTALFEVILVIILGMTGITVAIGIYNSKLESRISAQVTQLARLNEALRKRRFRGLVENGFDAISLLDEQLRPIYRSPAAERITGWSNEERTKVVGTEKVHPDDAERLRDIIRHLLSNPGKLFELTIRTQHKQGHYIWIEGIMKNMLHDEALQGIVSNFRDVSERKKIEEQRALYESIIQYSEDAIISKSMSGAVITWNRAAESLFGYKSEEIIGKSFALFTPEDLVDEELAIINKLQSGIPVENFETERLTKSGKRIHVSLTASPLLDPDGNIIGTSQIARDITERKMAEEKIHQLNIELERKVILRTNELTQVNSELKAVSDYIANGVNLPLQEIEKHIFFVQERLQIADPETAQSVSSISSSAREALRLISELIKFSQLTQRKVTKSYVDMNDMLQQIQRDLSPEIRSGFEMRFHNLHPVIADPVLLKELLLRLFEILDITHRHSERIVVTITSRLTGEYVRYCIDHWPLVFDEAMLNGGDDAGRFNLQPFNRSFISLLIIRHIVAKHSGVLQAEGAAGAASRIILSIPIATIRGMTPP